MLPIGYSAVRRESNFLKCGEILSLFQGEGEGELRLICGDGEVRIHSIILLAMSPLFRDVIMSQEGDYRTTRDILLPEFSLAEIIHLKELLYTGGLEGSEDEITKLRINLSVFGIDIDGKLTMDSVLDNSVEMASESESTVVATPSVAIGQSSTTTARGRRIKRRKYTEDQDNEEYNLGKREKRKVPKTRTPSPKKTPITTNKENGSSFRSRPRQKVRPPAPESPCNSSPESDSVSILSQPLEVEVCRSSEDDEEKGTIKNKIIEEGDKSKKDDYLSSDDFPTKKPKFVRKKFEEEVKRCQYCKKKYKVPADAANCISAHKKLRCYICFDVCSSTETLYAHYKEHHEDSENENKGNKDTLICPYCKQPIHYKQVSSHVISVHVPDTKESTFSKNKDDKDKRNSRGIDDDVEVESKTTKRKKSTSSTSSASRTASTASAASTLSREGDGDRGRPHSDAGMVTRANVGRPKKSNLLNAPSTSTRGDPFGIRGKPGFYYTKDGGIKARPLDITVTRRGTQDGRSWSWRIKKNTK